jgi:hypothetical protein
MAFGYHKGLPWWRASAIVQEMRTILPRIGKWRAALPAVIGLLFAHSVRLQLANERPSPPG